jgi:hypothetical protein
MKIRTFASLLAATALLSATSAFAGSVPTQPQVGVLDARINTAEQLVVKVSVPAAGEYCVLITQNPAAEGECFTFSATGATSADVPINAPLATVYRQGEKFQYTLLPATGPANTIGAAVYLEPKRGGEASNPYLMSIDTRSMGGTVSNPTPGVRN